MKPTDTIRAACIARAAELGLTAYAAAKLTGDAVTPDVMKDYLSGRTAMRSDKLSHVLRVLGLAVTERA